MPLGQIQTRNDRLHLAVSENNAAVAHIPIYRGQDAYSRPVRSVEADGLQIVEHIISMKFARDSVQLSCDMAKWLCISDLVT